MTRFLLATVGASLLAPTLCAAGEGNARTLRENSLLKKRKRVSPESPDNNTEERAAQTPKLSATKQEPTHKKPGSRLSPLGDDGDAKLAKLQKKASGPSPAWKLNKKTQTSPPTPRPCGTDHGAWVECAACRTGETKQLSVPPPTFKAPPPSVPPPTCKAPPSVRPPTFTAPPIALPEPSPPVADTSAFLGFLKAMHGAKAQQVEDERKAKLEEEKLALQLAEQAIRAEEVAEYEALLKKRAQQHSDAKQRVDEFIAHRMAALAAESSCGDGADGGVKRLRCKGCTALKKVVKCQIDFVRDLWFSKEWNQAQPESHFTQSESDIVAHAFEQPLCTCGVCDLDERERLWYKATDAMYWQNAATKRPFGKRLRKVASVNVKTVADAVNYENATEKALRLLEQHGMEKVKVQNAKRGPKKPKNSGASSPDSELLLALRDARYRGVEEGPMELMAEVFDEADV